MNDKMKLPEGKPQHKKTNHPGIDNSPIVGQPGPTVLDNPAWRQRPSPWPFNPSDTSPLEWWRTLPSDAFHDAECLLLEATLEQVDVLHGGADFAAALEGNSSAAIAVAFSVMPVEAFTLKTDIAMTALLRSALGRNAAAALVLAQVLGLTDLGHAFAKELATSWLTFGRHYSANRPKFRKAETLLLTAFQEHHRHGDDA